MNYPLTYKEYIEFAGKGMLMGLKCRKCSSVTAPPQMACFACGSTELERIQLSGIATIQTYSVIRVAPEGYNAPYVVALAELEEGAWVMGSMDYQYFEELGDEIIGAKVSIGQKIIPAALYSGGDGLDLVFTPCK